MPFHGSPAHGVGLHRKELPFCHGEMSRSPRLNRCWTQYKRNRVGDNLLLELGQSQTLIATWLNE